MKNVFILFIVPILMIFVGMCSYFFIDEIMYGTCENELFGCLRQIGVIIVVPIAWILSTIYYYLSVKSKLDYDNNLKSIIFSILIYFLIEVILIYFVNYIV